jgi:hypothetical protein
LEKIGDIMSNSRSISSFQKGREEPRTEMRGAVEGLGGEKFV